MPAVLRRNGISVMIFTNDHLPMNVHCFSAEMEVVIELDTMTIRDAKNPKGRFLKNAYELVDENHAFLISEWNRIRPVP